MAKKKKINPWSDDFPIQSVHVSVAMLNYERADTIPIPLQYFLGIPWFRSTNFVHYLYMAGSNMWLCISRKPIKDYKRLIPNISQIWRMRSTHWDHHPWNNENSVGKDTRTTPVVWLENPVKCSWLYLLVKNHPIHSREAAVRSFQGILFIDFVLVLWVTIKQKTHGNAVMLVTCP